MSSAQAGNAGGPALDGVLPVLPTPFDADGRLLLADVDRVVRWAIDRGAAGIVVLGVASEVFRLSDAERVEVVAAATAAADGRVPVIAGAGHLATELARAAAIAAVGAGARALLVPPPPVGRAPADAIMRYFGAIADAVDVPLILQDDPVHLGVGLSVPTIRELHRQHANCRFAKLEELPSMAKIRTVLDVTDGGVRCLGGSGGVYVLEELAAGATGIMTGFAFPEALVATYEAWVSGDPDAARRAFRTVGDLARLEALPGVSLSIRKKLYVERGALTSSALRSPAIEVDDWTWELARAELGRVTQEWHGSAQAPS